MKAPKTAKLHTSLKIHSVRTFLSRKTFETEGAAVELPNEKLMLV